MVSTKSGDKLLSVFSRLTPVLSFSRQSSDLSNLISLQSSVLSPLMVGERSVSL